MDLEIFITEDGSQSIINNDLHESYHSKFGALNESMFIFIDSGFNKLLQRKNINILEIGFGTGLNALLTSTKALNSEIEVIYHTIEPFPLGSGIYNNLNYQELLDQEGKTGIFEQLHEISWNASHKINSFFEITKYKQKLQDILLNQNFYDLIYFDAFAPDIQPELWTQQIFEKIFASMQHAGLLVTYSAKGVVRRNLMNAGFIVERIPGPKGKREIIRAKKPRE